MLASPPHFTCEKFSFPIKVVSKKLIGYIQSTFYTFQQLEFPWKTPKNGFKGFDYKKTESDKKILVRMRRNKNHKINAAQRITGNIL